MDAVLLMRLCLAGIFMRNKKYVVQLHKLFNAMDFRSRWNLNQNEKKPSDNRLHVGDVKSVNAPLLQTLLSTETLFFF
jgi:hypothetical protein